jgi:hypothetical protein
MTSTNHPGDEKGARAGAVGAGAHPGAPGSAARPTPESKQTPHPKPGTSTISDRTSAGLND